MKIRERNGQPFISDNGNLILDWQYGAIDDPYGVEMKLKAITGVVDSGIFAKVAAQVIVAEGSSIRKIVADNDFSNETRMQWNCSSAKSTDEQLNIEN